MTIKNGRVFPNSTLPLETAFADSAGAALDPATVTFRMISPRGQITTYVYGTDAELVRTAAGSYRVEVTPDMPGRWAYQWQSTGPAALDEDSFVCRNSAFYNDTCLGDYS